MASSIYGCCLQSIRGRMGETIKHFRNSRSFRSIIFAILSNPYSTSAPPYAIPHADGNGIQLPTSIPDVPLPSSRYAMDTTPRAIDVRLWSRYSECLWWRIRSAVHAWYPSAFFALSTYEYEYGFPAILLCNQSTSILASTATTTNARFSIIVFQPAPIPISTSASGVLSINLFSTPSHSTEPRTRPRPDSSTYETRINPSNPKFT